MRRRRAATQADNPRNGKIYRRLPNTVRDAKWLPSGGRSPYRIHTIVTTRRFITWIYATLFVGVGLLSGVFFFRTYQEYAQYQRLEADSRLRLAKAERRLQDQQRVLDRLRTDPEFVEKVIRQQLRYAKPSELIFRFED